MPTAATLRIPIGRTHAGAILTLKLQSGFASSVRQSLDSAVVQEATAVEHDPTHAGSLRRSGDLLADLRGFGHAVAFRLELDRRRGCQRLGGAVVDHLRVEVVEAAEDREPRLLRRPAHVHPHAAVPLRAALLAIDLLDHAAVLAPLPALPALRRIFSPRYMTPLPL